MGKLLGEGAELHTPFGATESLPVATIGHREVLRDCAPLTAQGAGVCVGRPVPGAVVRIIRISDAPIAAWSDDLLAPPGEVGEITVKGPQVTRSYHARPDQTALAKIQDGVDTVHRMGDVGYFDALGRLWMCGRKGHRVETAKGPRFSVRVEEVLNAHPAVKRTALVGVGPRGQQQPVVLVEREPGHEATSDAQLLTELKAMAAKVPACDGVTDVRTYQGAFPVDVRHNAKIEREKLARQVTEGRA
jgi:acyl-CoA synthetase (AMP-forming)/AMP-acid ligase II